MNICPICTSRHLTNNCATAQRYIDECLAGTPDDVAPIAVHLRAVGHDAVRRTTGRDIRQRGYAGRRRDSMRALRAQRRLNQTA